MNGERANVGKAMAEIGYSKSYCKSSTPVTQNPAFQEEMFDLVLELEKERQQMLIDMKDPARRDKASWRDMVEGFNKINNAILLITGKATSNEKITVSWE